MAGDYNIQRYVGNDPINLSDPSDMAPPGGGGGGGGPTPADVDAAIKDPEFENRLHAAYSTLTPDEQIEVYRISNCVERVFFILTHQREPQRVPENRNGGMRAMTPEKARQSQIDEEYFPDWLRYHNMSNRGPWEQSEYEALSRQRYHALNPSWTSVANEIAGPEGTLWSLVNGAGAAAYFRGSGRMAVSANPGSTPRRTNSNGPTRVTPLPGPSQDAIDRASRITLPQRSADDIAASRAQWVVIYGPRPNQMNQQIYRGAAPRTIIQVHTPRIPGEQLHVHLDGGHALNIDGTWKHGGRELTAAEEAWLRSNNWPL